MHILSIKTEMFCCTTIEVLLRKLAEGKDGNVVSTAEKSH
jgi:hypothetical protein